MSPTVFLDRPMGDATEIECTEVTVAGDLLRATDTDGGRTVVPLSNVAGVTGGEVTHDVEAVEYAGGRITEPVTRVS